MKNGLGTNCGMKRRKGTLLIALAIFGWMLILNMLSPRFTDDFHYLYNFSDGTRIENVFQIIPSMQAHRYTMNGRVVVHGLVQFLGLFPLWMFDILNAGMFVLQLQLIDYIGRGNREQNWALFAGLFAVFWMLCPAFGQTNLWQDGSCNYLWSIVVNFLFLLPFVEDFQRDRRIVSKAGKLGFLAASFCAGAYTETASAAAIGVAVLLVLLMAFWQKKKCGFWAAAIAAALCGYISIYMAPAQWMNKSAEMTVNSLAENMLYVFGRYVTSYWLVLGIFAVALAGNLIVKTDKKQILLSIVFFLGSLAAQGVVMFAKVYYNRTSLGAFAFLLVADWVLLYPLLNWKWGKQVLSVGMVLLVLSGVPSMADGFRDVMTTYQKLSWNEQQIYACKEKGILDVEIPVFYPETKYSQAHDLKYLDTETPKEWPNYILAEYYGVNTLLGVSE